MKTGKYQTKSIRRLILVSDLLSHAFLTGGFKSVFKGRGIEFDTVREYLPDDDARSIDWNTSGRFDKPYVKTWREDRALPVFVIFDESLSMHFGSNGAKIETAAAASSLIVSAAAKARASVGALFFSNRILSVFKPSSDFKRNKVLISKFESAIHEKDVPKGGTALKLALETTRRNLKKHSLLFVISDFLTTAEGPESWKKSMGLLSRKHDVIVIRIFDDTKTIAGDHTATLRVADAETGNITRLLLGKKGKSCMDSQIQEFRLEWLRALNATGASRIEIKTGEDPARSIIAFFERRRRRS